MLVKSNHLCLLVGVILLMPLDQVFGDKNYSPYADSEFPERVYWGDTHLHTSLSSDGFISALHGLSPVGRLDLADVYAYAKGNTITATDGSRVRLSRPLDFLVVADHAEAMGLMSGLANNDPLLRQTAKGRGWLETVKDLNSNYDAVKAESIAWSLDPDGTYFGKVDSPADFKFRRSVWEKAIDSAEEHNAPGVFTAFIGYEWAGMVYAGEGRGWWHRNVIFKDGGDKVRTVLPFSQLHGNQPEELWAYLRDYEKSTGGEALIIPHNPNLSGGNLFKTRDSNANSFSPEYALKRSRYEPLVEVTQTKGDSETHPLLSPNDEFADYETWTWFGNPGEADSKRQYDYARSGLKLGLQEQSKLGVNPFKFGMIGSTDSHNSLSNVEENNFGGKFLEFAPNKNRLIKSERWFEDIFKVKNSFTASGYAAIWATDNTRESLFAAMKRKEVYATTGPRISVRFFGGWDYQSDDALRPDLARVGYSKGVPMGGDLVDAAEYAAPTFLIHAVKDPIGANLDRAQVIKGWHDQDGQLHEKIYNVALSGNRRAGPQGGVPVVGNTVNLKQASYTNSIGDPELAVVWKDPDFDRDELAFYYLRVLEIPTPRWPAYDVKFYKLKDVLTDISMITQERAYSSPIWYTP